jgi:hypothetical protein
MEERMGWRADRVRPAEWLIGTAAVALLVDLLVVPWYSLGSAFSATSASFGAPTSATGIQAHHLLGPLAILCALSGLATWGLQASQAGPAAPACATVITAMITFVLSVGLLVRVVFVPPTVLLQGAPGVNTIKTDVGALLGLLFAVLLLLGAWWSLRTEGIAPGDAPASIPALALVQRSGADAA